jgi:hypothetical protein
MIPRWLPFGFRALPLGDPGHSFLGGFAARLGCLERRADARDCALLRAGDDVSVHVKRGRWGSVAEQRCNDSQGSDTFTSASVATKCHSECSEYPLPTMPAFAATTENDFECDPARAGKCGMSVLRDAKELPDRRVLPGVEEAVNQQAREDEPDWGDTYPRPSLGRCLVWLGRGDRRNARAAN